MKTPKNYKFSDTTLARIADIEAWLPADSATHAIEEAIADFHNRLKLRQQMGEFQAELAELWERLEKHPHYEAHIVRSTGEEGLEVMYNFKERAKWQSKGILQFAVLERKDNIYKTAYSLYKLNELASSERWFVP